MAVLTGGFLTLEVADQLDVLIDVVEALELTLIINDLHRVLNHLQSGSDMGRERREVKEEGEKRWREKIYARSGLEEI